MNSLVLDDTNEFVDTINYAHKVMNSSDKKLMYSMNLKNHMEFHKTKMDYLRKYIFLEGIEEILKATQERVDKFLSLENGLYSD